MGSDEILEQLNKEFPCREALIARLHCLIGQPAEPLPDCLFVHGPPATGKTSVVTSLLNMIAANYAVAKCIECYTPRLLLEPLLRKLTHYDDTNDSTKCDTMMDFVNKLKEAIANGSLRHCVIVLDGCEKLDQLYLPAFSRLQELMGCPYVCVVFVTHLVPEKFSNLERVNFSIFFKQYNKDELLRILMLTRPEGYDEPFYCNYLNLFISIFLNTTRDLSEMKHLAEVNFLKYVAPIESGLLTKDNAKGLWQNINPHLKASLHSVYLGTAANSSCDEPCPEAEQWGGPAVRPGGLLALDLPYCAKYFLVAAYLASYNAPKHDKRLYLKHHGKQRKRQQQLRAEKVTSDLLGPKPFSLDRLMAISYAIMHEKASLTANLQVQISSLVELRLLTQLGDGNLDKPKYKCAVGFDTVNKVAKTLQFNIRKYLIA